MKRKQIEQVPYITVPGIIKRERVKYVAVTAWKNIGKERHIFLEVYQNRQESLKCPVVRYVATKKNWEIFYPGKGVWNQKGINQSDDAFCWYDENDRRKYETWKETDEKNKLYSEKDLKRIQNFFGIKNDWGYGYWWEYFEKNETTIRNEIINKRKRKRLEKLKERLKNTPKLPEKEILNWAEERLFHGEHYLYYRKNGSRAVICCSKCGGVKAGKWKAGEAYEAQFESRIEEPRKGYRGKCNYCGAYGEYKPQGKAKGVCKKEMYLFTADKYKEKGAVIRYINLRKEWVLKEIAGEKGLLMSGAYENISGIELARAYFMPGEKIQIDFHKHSWLDGRDFWDDCNLYGMNVIKIEKAVLYPGMKEKLKGTCLQYSAIEFFSAKVGVVNAVDYMERYRKIPQIEMLVKMGLYGVAEELVSHSYGIAFNTHAASVKEFLGIAKEHIKLLSKEEGNIEILKIVQAEKRLGQKWKEEQIFALREIGADYHKIEVMTEVMTLQKALNLIARYAGCKYGTGSSYAKARLMHIATVYVDYLEMRKELGYDMENTMYQRPYNLEEAHNRMVEERDKEKIIKRIKEEEEKYPEIRKRYRSLRKKYFFEDEIYLIRPARSAEEIIREGRNLHHCVGGSHYLENHNKGYNIILFLRFQKEKDTSYITVEIKEKTIIQWHGAYNKKPDELNIQKWLNNYVTRLQCTGDNAEREVIRTMVG